MSKKTKITPQYHVGIAVNPLNPTVQKIALIYVGFRLIKKMVTGSIKLVCLFFKLYWRLLKGCLKGLKVVAILLQGIGQLITDKVLAARAAKAAKEAK